MKHLVFAAILVGASLIPTASSASAQTTNCTTTQSGNTLYTTCTEPPRSPTPTSRASAAANAEADAMMAGINARVEANLRYGQELENQRAAALARQQPGDTGMTISVYGKPIHHDYGEFVRGSDASQDVYMVANGQLHLLHTSAYADVGVVSDLSNVQVVTWMKLEMVGDSF